MARRSNYGFEKRQRELKKKKKKEAKAEAKRLKKEAAAAEEAGEIVGDVEIAAEEYDAAEADGSSLDVVEEVEEPRD